MSANPKTARLLLMLDAHRADRVHALIARLEIKFPSFVGEPLTIWCCSALVSPHPCSWRDGRRPGADGEHQLVPGAGRLAGRHGHHDGGGHRQQRGRPARRAECVNLQFDLCRRGHEVHCLGESQCSIRYRPVAVQPWSRRPYKTATIPLFGQHRGTDALCIGSASFLSVVLPNGS